MMTMQNLHRFLEFNLHGYQRRDVQKICEFYLITRGKEKKHPFKKVFDNFGDFKQFIIVDWQGEEGENKSNVFVKVIPEPEHGRCVCGKPYVIRTNSKNGNKFLGCSGYPTCKNVKAL